VPYKNLIPYARVVNNKKEIIHGSVTLTNTDTARHPVDYGYEKFIGMGIFDGLCRSFLHHQFL